VLILLPSSVGNDFKKLATANTISSRHGTGALIKTTLNMLQGWT